MSDALNRASLVVLVQMCVMPLSFLPRCHVVKAGERRRISRRILGSKLERCIVPLQYTQNKQLSNYTRREADWTASPVRLCYHTIFFGQTA